MQIRAAEISDIIRQQIKDYERQLEVRETAWSCRPATASRASTASTRWRPAS
jgi:hypothetical protein